MTRDSDEYPSSDASYTINVCRQCDDLSSTELRELGALQRVEAMAFTVNEINRRQDILPNVKLGFVIMDDCSKDTTALIRSLHFIQKEQRTSDVDHLRSIQVTAVIGSESSKSTVQIADLLSLFKVPILSYLSTSSLLSNKYIYPYFSRIVPSDTLQSKVIVDILEHFHWTYISVIYSEGSYGSEGYKEIKKRVEESGFCLAVQREMKQSFSDADYDAIVDELLSKPRAKVVVLFSPLYQARAFFFAVKRKNAQGKFSWIGSDGWGRNIQDYSGIEDIANGAIIINFFSKVVQRFDEYFQHLTPRNATNNPWFRDFFSSEMKCDFNASNSQKSCSEIFSFASAGRYTHETTVSHVIDAVYSYAYAIDRLTTHCPDNPITCFTSEQLLSSLRNTSFQGENGHIAIDSNGDGISIYQVHNYHFNGINYSLKMVGLWDSSNKLFKMFEPSSISWNPLVLNEKQTIPRSTCSDRCLPGFQAVVTQPHCCWYCQRCRDNEKTVIIGELPKCVVCPTSINFTWPNMHRTECKQITLTYASIDDFIGKAILALDCLTTVLWAVVTILYTRNHDKRLIKASSRELSFIMLFGIFLSNIVITLFVIKPSNASCIITYSMFHLSFTLNYGPLTVKTNRVYRIFTAGRRSNNKPAMIGSKAQILLTVLLLVAQTLVVFSGIFLNTPYAATVMPNLGEKYVEVRCVIPETSFLVALVCNLCLVIVCAFHAIKTRKLPQNYNESRFTSFLVYTTIVLWLAFVPTYFTTAKTTSRALLLSLAMLSNSLVTLIFLFVPKIYALYYVTTDAQNLINRTSVSQIATQNILKSHPRLPNSTNRVSPLHLET
ncbi:metabotropic glutamate receptor 3-like [Gigantopelta aegis]|uniref:metabotropic glutamate receptor 3-like n=1 Tax=Gigantopelta aegis TaxID=1735272 RepID=UPI001B88DE90|nr:metabotropic glutamate receptor 3-like [Gigantopelta aegis]